MPGAETRVVWEPGGLELFRGHRLGPWFGGFLRTGWLHSPPSGKPPSSSPKILNHGRDREGLAPLWKLAHPLDGASRIESASQPLSVRPSPGAQGWGWGSGTGIGFQSDKSPPSQGTAGQVSQAGHIYNSTVSVQRVEGGRARVGGRFISLIVALTVLGVRCHGPWGMRVGTGRELI